MRHILKSIILITLFLVPGSKALSSNRDIVLIDGNGKEKRPRLQTKTFVIAKVENGFRRNLYQTWVAVPPLLNLESNDRIYTIVENSEKNQSPFFKDGDVKKVIRAEHFSKNLVIPLKTKGQQQLNANNMLLKISDLEPGQSIIVEKSCLDLGISYKRQKKTKSLMTLDCRVTNNQIEMNISGITQADTAVSEETRDVTKKQLLNDIVLTFPESLDVTTGTRKLASLSEINGYKFEQSMELFYSGKVKKIVKSLKPLKYRFRSSGKVTKVLSQPSKHQKSDFRMRGGLFTSKLGVETEIGLLYSPAPQLYFLIWQTLFPLRIFSSENNENAYGETSATISFPQYLSRSLTLSLGAGLKAMKMGVSKTLHETLLGPEVQLNLTHHSLLGAGQKTSTSLKYTPHFFNSYVKGSRLLWDIANVDLFTMKSTDLSLTLRYSFFEFELNNQSYFDNKTMGGFLLKW